MNRLNFETPSLTLVLRSPAEVKAELETLDPAIRAEISPDWLRRIVDAVAPDPWIHGFALIHRASGAFVGTAGFKAPPSGEGVVEIAYRVESEHQNKGYASEAAQALTDFALECGEVRLVRAHTLPEPNPSTRVLTKCGFRCIGEVIDPEDGRVWRWEKP